MLGHYLLRRGDAWTRLAAWTVVYSIMSAAYRHDQGHGACACLPCQRITICVRRLHHDARCIEIGAQLGIWFLPGCSWLPMHASTTIDGRHATTLLTGISTCSDNRTVIPNLIRFCPALGPVPGATLGPQPRAVSEQMVPTDSYRCT